MSTDPLVSVVIPAFNQKDFIYDTLSSVISQTYRNLQILVVDDCSQDGTLDIIKYFAQNDSRIEFLNANQNLGISKNFNRGFDACKGEYIAFLGGDDLMMPEKIETQVRLLEENDDLVLIHHDAEFFNESGSFGKLSDYYSLPEHPLDWPLFYDWTFTRKPAGVLPSTCLARSWYYLHARYSEELKYKHELLFTIDNFCACPEGKWLALNDVLVKYRIHNSNFSRQDSNKKLIPEETYKMVEMVCQLYPNIKERAVQHLHYFEFKQLMFGWEKGNRQKRYVQFKKEAGLLKFFYLIVCRSLIKMRLFWPVIKMLKLLQR